MTKNNLDLAGIFQAVTESLVENQQTLDHADEYNCDHGTNMVQTFQTITNVLQAQKKKGASDSAALNNAAKQLSKKAGSSSGKLYAQNLARAATQFKGKKIDNKGALQLLQTLIGGEQQTDQADSQGGDLMSMLLGGLAGGGEGTQEESQAGGGDLMSTLLGSLAGGDTGAQPTSQPGGDLLGALLGGFGGGGESGSQPGGNLLGAVLGGLAGGSGGGLQSLVQAFLGGSGMGDSSHRTQSTAVVVNAFLQALGGKS